MVGDLRMKVGTQFMVSVGFLLAAYSLSAGGNEYSSIVLTLVALAALTFATFVASYESRSPRGSRYGTLRKLMMRSYILYAVDSCAALFLALIVSLPLKSPIYLTFTYGSTTAYTEVRIPLTSLIVTGLALAVLARPVILDKDLGKSAAFYVLVPAVGFLILYLIPIIVYGGEHADTFLLTSTLTSVAGVTGVAAALTCLIELVKRL